MTVAGNVFFKIVCNNNPFHTEGRLKSVQTAFICQTMGYGVDAYFPESYCTTALPLRNVSVRMGLPLMV